MYLFSFFLNKFMYSIIFGCMGFSLVAASRGYSLTAVCRLLIAVASLPAEPGLWGSRASVAVAHGLSS